ncbi:MAG: HRDC domain-containing protein [Myxococcota bacterium]
MKGTREEASTVTPPPPPTYIDTEEKLADWLSYCEGKTVLAVDTESDSFHHYREKVCLIQMSATGRDAIIDPLAVDIEPLRETLKDPKIAKIFHDAVYDLVCLKRDYDFEVEGIFDTMVASRLLGYKSFGLGPILNERFGFVANKKLQRSDWARRPLSAEQIDYARFDTHFLEELRIALIDELEAAGRLKWAEEEFARLPEVANRIRPRATGPDPDGFWRVKGIRNLGPEILGRIRSLHMAREKIAERVDRPPFKVFGDHVLVELARHPPKRLSDLRPRPGLRKAGVDRFGKEIFDALSKATPVKGKAPKGVGRRRRHGRFLDPDARQRYQDLRDVRKEVAGEIGIDPDVALGNAALEEFAKAPPSTLGDVRRHPEHEGWRAEYLAEPIYRALDGST